MHWNRWYNWTNSVHVQTGPQFALTNLRLFAWNFVASWHSWQPRQSILGMSLEGQTYLWHMLMSSCLAKGYLEIQKNKPSRGATNSVGMSAISGKTHGYLEILWSKTTMSRKVPQFNKNCFANAIIPPSLSQPFCKENHFPGWLVATCSYTTL